MSIVEKLTEIRNRSLAAWEDIDSWDVKGEDLALLVANKMESNLLKGREISGSKVVVGEYPEASLLRAINLLRAAGYRTYRVESIFPQTLCEGDLVLTTGSDGRAKLRKPSSGEKDKGRAMHVALFKEEE